MDFQREMFDKQLEANRRAIKDEYQQYRELGINPMAMNLQQTNMAGSAGSPASQPHQYTTPLERANIELIHSQARLNEKQADAIDPDEAPSRTALNRSSASWADAQKETEDLIRPFKKDLYQYQINDMIESVYYKDKQIEALDSQILSNKAYLDYLASDKFFEYLKTSTEVKKMNSETKALLASIAIDWYNAHTSRFNAETNRALADSQIELNEQQKELNHFEILKKELAHQLGVDYDEIEAAGMLYRKTYAESENQAIRLEFDTERYKNAPQMVKKYVWFYDTVGMFGGLGNKFLQQYVKTH